MTTHAIKPLGQIPPDIAWHDVVRHGEWDALRSYTEDCLARLRVAEGALKGIANGANGDHDQVCEEDSLTYKEIEDFACKALATIGSLPAPPTERSKDTI